MIYCLTNFFSFCYNHSNLKLFLQKKEEEIEICMVPSLKHLFFITKEENIQKKISKKREI